MQAPVSSTRIPRIVIVGGGASQKLATIDWSDRWHAALVVFITAVGVAAQEEKISRLVMLLVNGSAYGPAGAR